MATRFAPAGATEDTAPNGWLLPLRAAIHLQQSWFDVQRAQLRAVEAAGRDLATLSEELHDAKGPQDAIGLQVTYALEQAARLSQLSMQVLGSVFDAQSRGLRDVEVLAGGLVRRALGPVGARAAGQGSALAGLIDQSPSSWLAASQLAWNEGMRCWLDALDHDVEDDEPQEFDRQVRRLRP